jgi:hypothetical protein
MTKFEIALREKILTTIANLDGGTVGIGRDCLWQIVSKGASSLPGAPVGTNAPWVARSIFDAIVSGPAFSRFVY